MVAGRVEADADEVLVQGLRGREHGVALGAVGLRAGFMGGIYLKHAQHSPVGRRKCAPGGGRRASGRPVPLEVGSEARVAIGQPPPARRSCPPSTVEKLERKKNIALK